MSQIDVLINSLLNPTSLEGLKNQLVGVLPLIAKGGYQLFSANLTQLNTSAPTINVLYNDTGITFTGVYDGIGSYKLVADVAPLDDTKVQVFCGYGTGLINSMRWRAGEVLISVVDSGLNPVNGSLENTPIHILIWP